MYDFQLFFLIRWVVFSLCWCLLKHKSLNFDEIQFIDFFMDYAFSIYERFLHGIILGFYVFLQIYPFYLQFYILTHSWYFNICIVNNFFLSILFIHIFFLDYLAKFCHIIHLVKELVFNYSNFSIHFWCCAHFIYFCPFHLFCHHCYYFLTSHLFCFSVIFPTPESNA